MSKCGLNLVPRLASAMSDSDEDFVAHSASQRSSSNGGRADSPVVGDEGAGSGHGDDGGDESAARTHGGRTRISISLKRSSQAPVLPGSAGAASAVCHVCGKRGHNAGFVGAVYADCPNRPCYLCKQEGHTTQTCPYRIMPGQTGVSKKRSSLVTALAKRQVVGMPNRAKKLAPSSTIVKKWAVSAARLQLHSRRVSDALFHPIFPLVVTADKVSSEQVSLRQGCG